MGTTPKQILVSSNLHRAIKMVAAGLGLSIGDYIKDLVVKDLQTREGFPYVKQILAEEREKNHAKRKR